MLVNGLMKIWSGRMMFSKLKEHGIEIILTVLFMFAFVAGSKASHDWGKPNMYQFPAPDLITMDVVKNDGIEGGGTYICKDVWSCYLYVQSAEKRGATEYCKTIDIRKNGRRVWFKRYQ